MAKYEVTFSCGHSGVVSLFGKIKDRKRTLKWYEESGLCPDCWQKYLDEQRQRKNMEAAQANKEAGLPALEGTEKQIAWAETIRKALLERTMETINDFLETLEHKKNVKEEITDEKIEEAKLVMFAGLEEMKKITSASWWIEHRDLHWREGILKLLEKLYKDIEERKMKKLIEKEKIEKIVYPENKITDVAVDMILLENRIQLKFERNDKFIKIVKNLGYVWDTKEKVWARRITQFTGSIKDRAAEVANHLLNEGFPVVIYDDEIRQMAIEGNYEPECTRWITARTDGEYKGWFAIWWEGINDKLYRAASSLPGAKWSKPSVVVRPEYYKEVQEFAELYGFKFSPGAKQLIEEYLEATKDVETVKPAKVEKIEQEDGLEKILQSNSDILEDLKDD